jgi:hypothetical protein
MPDGDGKLVPRATHEPAQHLCVSPAIIGSLEAMMFERDEVLQDLYGRLVSAGIDPRDPKVQTICDIVNTFYAEKTRQVLEQVQTVLSKIET